MEMVYLSIFSYACLTNQIKVSNRLDVFGH